MKVWLNNLKEGNIFYHIMLHNIYKCRHLGDAHNMNFRMNRIKFEILGDDNNTSSLLKTLIGNDHEAFVNQYVYDDYDSAVEALKEELQSDLDLTLKSIILKKREIEDLEHEVKEIKKLIEKYAEQDMAKNIKE